MLRYLFRRFFRRNRTEQGRANGFHLAGVVRVVFFCTVVSMAFTVLTIRSVYAAMKESATRIGRDMLKLKDVLGPAQAVHLNGTTIFAGGRHLDMGVKEFLDRFEQHCEERSAGIEQDLEKLPALRKRAVADEWRNGRRLGVMRTEADDKEGSLSCIVHPEGASGVFDLVSRIAAFMETGDVSRIGHLRFVFAKKNEELGGSDIVTLWNDGPFNVEQMLANEGDVPGRDTEAAPRLPDSRRIVSAEVEGVPYALRTYESSRSLSAVLEFYDHDMPGWGWKPAALPPEAREDARNQRVFVRNNAALFIEAADDGGPTTTFQVIEMGSRGALQVEVAEPQ